MSSSSARTIGILAAISVFAIVIAAAFFTGAKQGDLGEYEDEY